MDMKQMWPPSIKIKFVKVVPVLTDELAASRQESFHFQGKEEYQCHDRYKSGAEHDQLQLGSWPRNLLHHLVGHGDGVGLGAIERVVYLL